MRINSSVVTFYQQILKTDLLSVLLITISAVFGARTNFVDRNSKIKTFAEKDWYLENIPYVELPHKQIEEIYYYRWSLLKRHLRYLPSGYGYLITEFVLPVGWDDKFNSINDAAGHHINEAKWMRNKNYVQDYINFWSRGGSSVHHFSEWIAESVWNAYGINGDKEFVKSQLKGLVQNYNGWSSTTRWDSTIGLYHLPPSYDAQEYSCASMQTSDQHSGGDGYRPSFNSEMYANALAIANIAALSGDTTTQKDFNTKAGNLRANILKYLWDGTRHFFYHMQRDNNTNHALLDSREEVGFFPFRFNVPDSESYAVMWSQLSDPEGFNTTYGPSTCEKRSKWYDGKQVKTCCLWNGNSWPYSTSLALGALANTINNYKQTVVDKYNFLALMAQYARISYKNGKPYVAECHSPEAERWVCDEVNHSEHYLHSAYVDNVLTDLIGIKPRSDNMVEVNPLVADDWDYWIAENVAYHGHDLTVLWDKTGTHYKAGKGFKIFLNGEEIASKDTVQHLTVEITAPNITTVRPTLENYAANVHQSGYPTPTASYTDTTNSSVWLGIDGRIWYDKVPRNRWDNWHSSNTEDWYAIDFGPGRERTINEIRIYIYSDVATGEGIVDCPTAMNVQVFNNATKVWTDVSNQVHKPTTCSPNDVNTITFTAVKTEQVRVVFTRNSAKGYFVGFTELEIWANFPHSGENVYEAEDGIITKSAIRASPTASSGAYVGSIDATDASVEFAGVWSANESQQKLRVFYNTNATSTHRLIVNNINTITVNYPKNSDTWGVFNTTNNYVEVTVPLLKGNNLLLFRHETNYVELDKIQLVTTAT